MCHSVACWSKLATEAGVSAIDPRVLRSREAAVDAAITLLRRDGLGELTHVNIARESGVGRSTLYRHWPTMIDLILDLLREFRMPQFEPLDAPVRERLRYNLYIQRSRLFDPEYLAVYSAVSHYAMEPRVQDRLQAINGERVQSVAQALAPDYELEGRHDVVVELLALLNGPLLQMATFVGTTSPALIEATLDGVMRYLDLRVAEQA